MQTCLRLVGVSTVKVYIVSSSGQSTSSLNIHVADSSKILVSAYPTIRVWWHNRQDHTTLMSSVRRLPKYD
jgi:hypothetical protein